MDHERLADVQQPGIKPARHRPANHEGTQADSGHPAQPKKPQNINAQYAIDIPRGGSTVWTTGAVDDTLSIWDKNSGALIKRLPGVAHSRGLTFVEELGIAVVATAKPASLSFFDIATYKRLGMVKLPHSPAADYAPGLDVSGASRQGADVTVSSYYANLSQFRLTRSGDRVNAAVRWSTPLPGSQGHGDVLAVPSQNAAYVTNLYLGTVSRYDLRSGRHLADILTGPGPTTLARDPRRRIVYVTNYFGGFISVINERTGAVSRVMTTGLLPNKILMDGSTAIVLDKSSAFLAGGILADQGVDRVWKITPTR